MAKPDPATKIPTTSDQGALANNTRQKLQELEVKYKAQGISAAEAWNPKSPNYVGNKVRVTPPKLYGSSHEPHRSVWKKRALGHACSPNTAPKAAPIAPPKIGEVRQGFRLKLGGDAKNKANWSPQ